MFEIRKGLEHDSPMAKLIFTDKNFSGRVYELVLEKTTVGRGDQNTLVIRDSSLSSTHCEILVYGSEIIVRDLDSRNGTYVEGVRLNKQSQVKAGQTVRFGAVEARLELEPRKEDTEITEITAIYAHGKAMRDQRRAQKQPKPANPSMHLEPDEEAAPGEHTLQLTRADLPQPAPVPAASTSAQPRAETRSTGRLIIFGVVVLGLIVVLWLIWGRK